MMESEKGLGTDRGGGKERVLFEVGEVKSALAHSLNATEIFWSDWLQLIQHFELLIVPL